MICNKCGAALPDNSKFCTSCGNKINITAASVQTGRKCPKCGMSVKDGVKFCVSCGNKMPEIAQAVNDNSQRHYKLLDIPIDDSKDINVLHKRAFIYLEDEKYDEAYTYFEHFLDNDPEDAQAFYGKLMMDLGFKSEDEFETLDRDITENKNFKRAYKYGDEALRKKLDSYTEKAKYGAFISKLNQITSIEDIDKIKNEIGSDEKDRDKMLAACEEKRNAVLEETYQQAIDLKNKVRTIPQAKQAWYRFDKLGDYKDSRMLAEECRRIEQKIIDEENEQKYSKALKIKIDVAEGRVNYFETASSLNTAINIFSELGNYKDSQKQLTVCQNILRAHNNVNQ